MSEVDAGQQALADRDARFLELLVKAKQKAQKESDTLIIKTMKFAVRGMVAIIVVFILYVLCELYVGSRLGGVERRLDKLEQKR